MAGLDEILFVGSGSNELLGTRASLMLRAEVPISFITCKYTSPNQAEAAVEFEAAAALGKSGAAQL